MQENAPNSVRVVSAKKGEGGREDNPMPRIEQRKKKFNIHLRNLKEEIHWVADHRSLPCLQQFRLSSNWDVQALLLYIITLPSYKYKWQDHCLKDLIIGSLSATLFRSYYNPNNFSFDIGAGQHMIHSVLEEGTLRLYNRSSAHAQALLIPYVLLTQTTDKDRDLFAKIVNHKDGLGIFNCFFIRRNAIRFKSQADIHSAITNEDPDKQQQHP